VIQFFKRFGAGIEFYKHIITFAQLLDFVCELFFAPFRNFADRTARFYYALDLFRNGSRFLFRCIRVNNK
jgi:hypothetical protein